MKKIIMTIAILATFLISADYSYSKIWIITAGNAGFSPDTLVDIPTGDTIRFQWLNGSYSTTSTQIPEGAEDWDEPLTQESPTFTYVTKVPGTYYYTSFKPEMTGSFVVRNASGINENDAPVISVWPDPFTDRLTVTANGKQIDFVRIYDTPGKLIVSEDITAEKAVIDNLGTLAPGTYIISVTTHDKKTFGKKITHR